MKGAWMNMKAAEAVDTKKVKTKAAKAAQPVIIVFLDGKLSRNLLGKAAASGAEKFRIYFLFKCFWWAAS